MKRLVLVALCVLVLPSASADGGEPTGAKQADKSNADEAWRVALELQHNQRILSRKDIEAALAPHLPAIRSCYLRHVSKPRDANAPLILELLIHPEGNVHWMWARVRRVRGKKLNKCIRKLSTSWVFPKRPGFTNAMIPFSFDEDQNKT